MNVVIKEVFTLFEIHFAAELLTDSRKAIGATNAASQHFDDNLLPKMLDIIDVRDTENNWVAPFPSEWRQYVEYVSKLTRRQRGLEPRDKINRGR